MRVWGDLLTPKDILFFPPVIEKLKGEGAEVLLTSRRYREVGPLAERAGLDVTYVGDRGGKGREEQLVAATRRQAEMIPVVQAFKPDVAFSIASVVCARIAFGLGIKHVAVNDSPHAEVACRLTIPLSHHLLCPWVIPYSAWRRFGIQKGKITTYRALDPAAWLKRPPVAGPTPELEPGKKTITVRVQESDAPYLARADVGWTDRVLSSLLEAFPDANHVALCRYDYQVEEVRTKFGSRWTVPDEIVSGHSLLASTDLFVGMGGTMSAEAALMGVPTISAFQGALFTDRYLEGRGLLARALTTSALLSRAKRLLADSYRASYGERAKRVLDAMEDPVPKVAALIGQAANQA